MLGVKPSEGFSKLQQGDNGECVRTPDALEVSVRALRIFWFLPGHGYSPHVVGHAWHFGLVVASQLVVPFCRVSEAVPRKCARGTGRSETANECALHARHIEPVKVF